MKGLKQSRWAPSSARSTSTEYHHLKGSVSNPHLAALGLRKSSAEKRQIAQLQAYQKYLKALRRLKWKSATLVFCHHRALMQQTDNVIAGINFPITSDTGKANAAEVMFKVDFFEFYALLERVLVHLLETFGIVIHADHTSNVVPLPLVERNLNRVDIATENSLIGDSVAFHGYTHRFHANVLGALDRPSNPLHHILGTGIVRQYLGISKEFRNRWKEAEMETGVDHVHQFAGMHKSYHEILADLKLDQMLATILSALDQAQGLTSAQLASTHGSVEVDMIKADDEDTMTDTMMVEDAMDWD